MMNVRGSIDIRTIDGRNGQFNVGTITTTLGEFRTKDACIEELEPGRYMGEFTIERIHPTSYFSGPRLIIEIRAELAGMSLDDVDELPPESEQEPDPADEPVPLTAPEPKPEPAPAAEPDGDAQERDIDQGATDDKLRALFGDELFPLQETVKLDPTVDRKRFRAQRDELKRLNYHFDFENQVWKQAA